MGFDYVFLKVVLLAAAAAVLAICSLVIGVGADISIDSSFEIGDLSAVYERFALVKLSNGFNQDSWSQLGNEPWHESAFPSFFSVGSLDANQMNALAAQNNRTDPWKSANVTVKSTGDLISRLQQLSTARYQMSRSIPGTGNIKASMWTLMFNCGSTSCSDGYMVPIQIAAAEQSTLYSYVTAWLPVTDDVLMNAIPASISKREAQTISQEGNDPTRISVISTAFNIQKDLPSCPKARVHSFRTLLDSAYGLAPAIACLGFSDDESFKIVVTSASLSNGRDSDGNTVKHNSTDLGSLARLYGLEWSPQPFEQCSQRPLLILPEGPRDSDSHPHMCHHSKCLSFFPENQTGVQFLKGLEEVLHEGPSQCTSMGNSIPCADSLYKISSFYDVNSELDPLPSSLRSSHWASEQGKYTSEFYYAPHRENLTACAIQLTPPSSQLNHPKEIQIQAMDYLTAYITEHNTAFTTAKGSATDPYTFYALLVTTALSVITIALPFTSFMLGIIVRHMCPFFFSVPPKGRHCTRASMASKVFILVLFNVVLTLASFLPVLSLAKNEMDRQIKFSTWALASDDLLSADFSPAPIRIVYLFAITSQYKSTFLLVIVLVICFTCLPIAVCTGWRCVQVFERYQVLIATDTTLITQAKLTASDAIMQALKAIEMGQAEYLGLKNKAERQLPSVSMKVHINRSRSC